MNKREVSAQGARQHQGGAEHLPVGGASLAGTSMFLIMASAAQTA